MTQISGTPRISTMRYYVTLLALYTLNHGWVLLLAGAIYWDDWVLFGVPPADILERFQQMGMTTWYPAGPLHVVLLEAGPWLYRVLTFGLMFGAGVALDRVLRRHPAMTDQFRYLTVLLFLILPFYWARVALIDIHYTICYFFFFLAWALMPRHRALSVALFFLSFATNSLLVFFALPVAERFLLLNPVDRSPRAAGRFVRQNLDFILAPLVFFALKIWLFRPYGAYAGYNEGYSATNLLLSPIRQWNDLLEAIAQFAGTMRLSASTSLTPQFVLAMTSVVVAICLLKLRFLLGRNADQRVGNDGRVRGWAVVGMAAIGLALFPYWIIGKPPTFGSWGSRHQLLLALGVALMIAATIPPAGRWRDRLALILVGTCTYLNAYTYVSFAVDWHKQQSLVKLFQQDRAVADASVVVLDDQSIAINAIRRRFDFYEWSGLLGMAFGSDKRLGVDERQLARFESGELNWLLPYSHLYRFGEIDLSAPLETVQVTIREDRPDGWRGRIGQLGLPLFTLSVDRLPATTLPNP
jgi:hypothetical protein